MNNIVVYTLDEVAKILRVCTKTIYTRIKAGELKAYKEGNYWRIKKTDLDNYLSKKGENELIK